MAPEIAAARHRKIVINLEKSVAGTGPLKIVSSRADQPFNDMKPEQIAKLPTYNGELLLTQHSAGSISSQAHMKRWNRKGELLADTAERASVAAAWLGARATRRNRFTRRGYSAGFANARHFARHQFATRL